MRYCAECTYMLLGDNHEVDGKFWCESKGEYLYADSAECWNFCQAYSRSTSVANSYIEYSKSKQSSGGCYITTIVCDILKLPDNTKILTTLRNFRENILTQDEKYKELLVTYDITGPIIANHIKQDPKQNFLAKILYTSCLTQICNSIENKEYLKAIQDYTKMTKALMKKYGITKIPTTLEIQEANIKTSGHGRYITKPKNC